MNNTTLERILVHVQMLNLNYMMGENHRLGLLSDAKYMAYLRKQYELISQLERGSQEASE